QELLVVTGSEYGFIGEVLHDGTQNYLRTRAITDISWDEATHAFYEENASEGLEFFSLGTLFGHTLSTGEPVITNRPSAHPSSGGLPEGHPPLNAYMGLPIMSGSTMIGMVGLANRAEGYDEEIEALVEPLLLTCAGLISVTRSDVQRRMSEMRSVYGREFLAAVVDSAATAILTSSEDGTIETANPAVERLFGYPPASLLGKNLTMLMPPRQASEHAGYIHRYMDGGRPRIIGIGREVQGRHADGDVFPVHLAVSEFVVEGKRHFAGIITDLSQQKETERLLIQARDEAQRADRAKSDFLATVSHEIRTPMNGIMGMASLLMDTDLTPEQLDRVSTIQGSTQSLLGLINDLLDFSKVSAGQMELEAAPFDPVRAIQDVMRLYAERARSTGVSLRMFVDGWSPVAVSGDVTRLSQILLNLVSNGLKFSEGGRVTVRIRADPLEERDAARLRFEVSDSGIGIPADRLESIFDPFTQADSSTTRRFGGTGLGLPISRKIAEAMGGTLSVESVEGEGSTFTFAVELPLAAATSVHGDVLLVCPSPEDRSALSGRILAVGGKAFPVAGTAAAGELLEGGSFFNTVLVSPDLASEWDVGGLAARYRHTAFVALESGPARVREWADRGWTGAFPSPLTDGDLLRAVTLGRDRLTRTDPIANESGKSADPVSLRVLVVEDNTVNQRVVDGFLEHMGHRRQVVSNGVEALDALAQSDFDVILMDVRMPEMDGIEATRRIREKDGGGPRIIFMTADALPSTIATCRAVGGDEVLTKPVDRGVLEAAMRRAADGKAVREADAAGDRLLDPKVIRRSFSRTAVIREVLEEFRGATGDRALRIREAIDGRDAATLKAEAHGLRSAAGVLGSTRLNTVATALDHLPPESDWDEWRRLGEELSRSLRDIAPAITEFLNTLES
ncbi:MAG: ATP-binding protein, partial [Gemmatimonadota bacterium]|nr:ATP-binding protein [Gemmatimonadota bacterium]